MDTFAHRQENVFFQINAQTMLKYRIPQPAPPHNPSAVTPVPAP